MRGYNLCTALVNCFRPLSFLIILVYRKKESRFRLLRVFYFYCFTPYFLTEVRTRLQTIIFFGLRFRIFLAWRTMEAADPSISGGGTPAAAAASILTLYSLGLPTKALWVSSSSSFLLPSGAKRATGPVLAVRSRAALLPPHEWVREWVNVYISSLPRGWWERKRRK